MSDAAYIVRTRDAESTPVNFFVDDVLLCEQGVTDLEKNRVTPGASDFIPDISID